MIVEVTQEDIDKGKRWSFHDDPINLALQRVFPNSKIIVEKTHITIRNPISVVNFVERLDQQEHVDPFSFEL